MNGHPHRISAHRGLLAALAALWLVPAAAVEPETWELPELSEPANVILSPLQEKHLAQVLRAEVYGQMQISDDPEANSYLKTLAQQIVDANGLEQNFDILLVEDDVINAFAMPGGVLAFYTGLLQQARNESELAGVIAHEIAHVTQRHAVRRSKKLDDSGITSLGVAAILLGGLISPSTAISTAYVTQAVGIQLALNYTRHHEQEADRIATQFLATAGIDPLGMSTFFEILMNRGGLSYDDELVYLSTHPTSPSRLAEARLRAEQYDANYPADSEAFHYIRNRLMSLLVRPNDRLRRDQARLSAGASRPPAWRYGIAISHQRKAEHTQALAILNTLEPETADAQRYVALARAHSYKMLGEWAKPYEILLDLEEKYPHDYAVEWYLIQHYLDAGEGASALRLARARVRRGIDEPQTYRLLAQAADADDQPVASHMALADFHIRRAEYHLAENQLRLAQRQASGSSANRARIAARRAEIRWMQEDKT